MIKRRNDLRILYNEAKGERITAQAIKVAVQNKTWKDMADICVQAPSRYDEAMGPLPQDSYPNDSCPFLKEMYRRVKSFNDPVFAPTAPKKSVQQTKSITSKGTKSQKKSSKSTQPNKKKDVAAKPNKKKAAKATNPNEKKAAAAKGKRMMRETSSHKPRLWPASSLSTRTRRSVMTLISIMHSMI